MGATLNNQAQLDNESIQFNLSRESIRLGAGSEVDRAVLEAIKSPGPQTRDALYYTLRDARAGAIDRRDFRALGRRIERRFETLERETNELVETINRLEPVATRAALLVNLGKKVWGPIGGRENYDSGVPPEELEQHRRYFARFVELGDGMRALRDAYQYLAATAAMGEPGHDAGKAAVAKMDLWKSLEGGKDRFFRLLSKAEKTEVLRASLLSADGKGVKGNEWYLDCLDYLVIGQGERKQLLQGALSDPAAARKVKNLLHDLRLRAGEAEDCIKEISRALKGRPDLRAHLWLDLVASLRCYRGSWEGLERLKSKDEGTFRAQRKQYLNRREAADEVFSQIQRMRAALTQGDPLDNAPSEDPIMRRALGAWGNEENVVGQLLTKIERNAFLKDRISGLLKDESYEGGRELGQLLDYMAPTARERKDLLQTLFTKDFLERTLLGLKEKLQERETSAQRYREYIEEVAQRLDRFASIFSEDRESWGFRNAVDFEDLRDERNAAQEIGERNKAANAVRERLSVLAKVLSEEEGD